MLVSNRMTKDPVTVTADDLLIQARLKMQKGSFRQLPVASNGQLVGIITDRDMREMPDIWIGPKLKQRCPKSRSV